MKIEFEFEIIWKRRNCCVMYGSPLQFLTPTFYGLETASRFEIENVFFEIRFRSESSRRDSMQLVKLSKLIFSGRIARWDQLVQLCHQNLVPK